MLVALVDRNHQKKITFAHLYTVRLNKLKTQVHDVLNFSLIKKKLSVVVIKVKGFFFIKRKVYKLNLSYYIIKAKMAQFPGD